MIDLDAKVSFLQQPGSYPHPTERVDAIETHMSWVFLADAFVYKLKKPVRTSFLDFSTLALRKHFCDEEVRLNRRLAPHVYLQTVALVWAPAGLSLDGAGHVIDWLVKMARLPSDRMLDHAIRCGRVNSGDLDRLAARLTDFYRTASPIHMSAEDYLNRYRCDVLDNRAVLSEATGILPLSEVRRIHDAQIAFLLKPGSPIAARALEGKIVEAHGDLRPEHVFLGPDPQIIDCLEFNRAFRCLDPLDELCFLAVECEALGAPANARRLGRRRSAPGFCRTIAARRVRTRLDLCSISTNATVPAFARSWPFCICGSRRCVSRSAGPSRPATTCSWRAAMRTSSCRAEVRPGAALPASRLHESAGLPPLQAARSRARSLSSRSHREAGGTAGQCR